MNNDQKSTPGRALSYTVLLPLNQKSHCGCKPTLRRQQACPVFRFMKTCIPIVLTFLVYDTSTISVAKSGSWSGGHGKAKHLHWPYRKYTKLLAPTVFKPPMAVYTLLRRFCCSALCQPLLLLLGCPRAGVRNALHKVLISFGAC